MVTGDVLVQIDNPTYQLVRYNTPAIRALGGGESPLPRPMQDLLQRLQAGGQTNPDYLARLPQTEADLPHVWLPARPIHGQPARLLPGDWGTAIDRNRELVQRWFRGRSP